MVTHVVAARGVRPKTLHGAGFLRRGGRRLQRRQRRSVCEKVADHTAEEALELRDDDLLNNRLALPCLGVSVGVTSGVGLQLQPAHPYADSRRTSRLRACAGDMPSYPDTRKPRASSRAFRSA